MIKKIIQTFPFFIRKQIMILSLAKIFCDCKFKITNSTSKKSEEYYTPVIWKFYKMFKKDKLVKTNH